MLIMMSVFSSMCRCGERGSTGRDHTDKSQIDCRSDSGKDASETCDAAYVWSPLPHGYRIRSFLRSVYRRLPLLATQTNRRSARPSRPPRPHVHDERMESPKMIERGVGVKYAAAPTFRFSPASRSRLFERSGRKPFRHAAPRLQSTPSGILSLGKDSAWTAAALSA